MTSQSLSSLPSFHNRFCWYSDCNNSFVFFSRWTFNDSTKRRELQNETLKEIEKEVLGVRESHDNVWSRDLLKCILFYIPISLFSPAGDHGCFSTLESLRERERHSSTISYYLLPWNESSHLPVLHWSLHSVQKDPLQPVSSLCWWKDSITSTNSHLLPQHLIFTIHSRENFVEVDFLLRK